MPIEQRRRAGTGFDELHAVTEILRAMEFPHKRKGDWDILDPILDKYGVRSRSDVEAAARLIVDTPGFESFFLDVASAIRPFALMLSEVYSFLNEQCATVRRRASKFLVSYTGASASLTFDLDNFPRQFLEELSRDLLAENLIELRLPRESSEPEVGPWRFISQPDQDPRKAAEIAWHAASAGLDGYYLEPTGFLAALACARLFASQHPEMSLTVVEDIAEPIIDRLAAIVVHFRDVILPALDVSAYTSLPGWATVGSNQTSYPEALVEGMAGISGRGHRIDRMVEFDSGQVISLPIIPVQWRDSGFSAFVMSVRTMATYVREFREGDVPTMGNPQELSRRLGTSFENITPEEYVRCLSRTAEEYGRALDRVAPVTNIKTYEQEIPRLVELLALPFWAQRSYLYQLWTLVHVLEIAKKRWAITLHGLEEREGAIEWSLPGGNSRTPVASIVHRESSREFRVAAWVERRTPKTQTQAGLEPDLRLMTSDVAARDLFIVENKDRITVLTAALREILGRYFGLTKARSVWIVNYMKFPAVASRLEQSGPRSIHIASNFRPGNIPPSFEDELTRVLRGYFTEQATALPGPVHPLRGGKGPERQPASQAFEAAELDATSQQGDSLGHELSSAPREIVGAGTFEAEISLRWSNPPNDLDLHAWLTNGPLKAHVYYSARGELPNWPHAELDADQRFGGTEQIRASLAHGTSMLVAVHQYSANGGIANTDATVTLVCEAGEVYVERSPAHGAGAWWHVFSITDGRVDRPNVLSDEPPAAH